MTTTDYDDISVEQKAEPEPETPAQLEQDIEEIRNHLSDVAGELDRRRHRFMDVPGQVRRHAKPIAAGALALAALGAGIWWWRSRQQRGLTGRLRALVPESVASGEWLDEVRGRLAQAVRPRPAPQPVRGALLKIATAGFGAAASMLGRHLALKLAEGRSPTPATERENGLTSFAR
jgi:hypothetical protein